MESKFSASFEWSIKASVLQQKLLVAAHALAVVALFISAIAPIYKTLLVLSVFVSACVYWRVYGSGIGTITLRYTEAFGWEILINNDFRPIKILKSTVLSTWVILLHYQMDNNTRYRAIFYDALNKENFCLLIAQLKIAGLDDR